MQKRTLLKLGVASATLLVMAGGVVSLFQPGLHEGRLTSASRLVFGAVGRAMLEGSLPTENAPSEIALEGLLTRIDGLVHALPPHAQGELSQLLALLAAAPGRLMLTGLGADWVTATVPQVQQALQAMRFSAISLRQQAYHALHDIVGGAYFSDASTWPQLGYPGPQRL